MFPEILDLFPKHLELFLLNMLRNVLKISKSKFVSFFTMSQKRFNLSESILYWRLRLFLSVNQPVHQRNQLGPQVSATLFSTGVHL